MTKFLKYIAESRTQSIDENEADALIIKHCKNNYKFLKGNVILYRGVDNTSEYGYIDSNKGTPRMSRGTLNYITLLMDNLPSWKSYPKRSHGVICSTIESSASYYGTTLYRVIPYDNSKVGVCSSNDMWSSFDSKTDIVYTTTAANSLLSKLFHTYKIRVDDSNWNSFKSGLSKLNQNDILEAFGTSYPLTRFLFKKDTDIIEHFNEFFDPKSNGFTMGINNIDDDKEVWVQGECILIRDDVY